MIPGGAARRPRPLAEALDRAIAEENAVAVADDTEEAEARRQLEAERWAAIRAAQDVAGVHAVVLPIATTRDVVDYLREHPDAEKLVDLFAPLEPGRPAIPLSTLIALVEAAYPDRLT